MNAVAEPTPTLPRTRRRVATRARILGAAAELLRVGGLASFSLHRVADEVDLTAAALYRYFPSKDALLAEVLGGVIAALARDLAATGQRHASASPLDRVRALVTRWLATSRDDPHRFSLVRELLATPDRVLTDDGAAAAAVDAMFLAMRPLSDALEAAVAAGLLAPGSAERRALTLLAMTEGLLLFRKQAARAPQRVPQPEPLILETLEDLLRGWSPAPSPPPAPRRARPGSPA
jgi:AcrR family transcriptional regulator